MKNKHNLTLKLISIFLFFLISILLNGCADREKTPPQKLNKNVRIAVVTFCASEVIYFGDDANNMPILAQAGAGVYLQKVVNKALEKGLRVSTPVIDSHLSVSKLGSGLFKGDTYHSAHEKLGIVKIDDTSVLPQSLVNQLDADAFLWVSTKFSFSSGKSKIAAKLKWEKSISCDIESDVKLFEKYGTEIWSSKFSTYYKVPFKGEYKVLSQSSSISGKDAFRSIEYVSIYAADEMVNRLIAAINSSDSF
jgi:hypothetical protein